MCFAGAPVIQGRQAARFVGLLLALALSGCAGLSERDQAMAYVEPGFTPLPAYTITVADPHSICTAIGTRAGVDTRILACADPYGKIIAGLCLIVLPFDAWDWLIDHEHLHCLRGRWHG